VGRHPQVGINEVTVGRPPQESAGNFARGWPFGLPHVEVRLLEVNEFDVAFVAG
jgi:hypothetical protein